MSTSLNLLVERSRSKEVHLPSPPPLTLTRNFGWVFFVCLATLIAAPLLIAWTASILLT
ncbi:MAG TPA: hypothetical protein VGN88_13605 [Phycisphaerae bacterium]|jgi:hypothetical protein